MAVSVRVTGYGLGVRVPYETGELAGWIKMMTKFRKKKWDNFYPIIVTSAFVLRPLYTVVTSPASLLKLYKMNQ